MKTSGWIVVLVLAGAVAGSVYWLKSPARGTAVTEALAAGNVEIVAAVAGADGDSVSVTLRRPPGVTGRQRIAIPTGLVLYTGSSQRLIVAVPAVFDLSDAQPEATQLVSTFCIDQFLPTPAAGAAVSLTSGGESGATSATAGTDPLRKLVECLADIDLPQADKQLAVWAVSENLMEGSRDEATAALTRKRVERMGIERRAELEARKAELMTRAPHLSEARIDALIEDELRDGNADMLAIASRESEKQMWNFVEHDKIAMSTCGYPVFTMQIFQ
ncbi:MAG: hypothetical protein NT117_03180 [Gammaproteobacteria bacterium]|nr:hypothetical protein [Gammaproteobacteria bacterium]